MFIELSDSFLLGTEGLVLVWFIDIIFDSSGYSGIVMNWSLSTFM